jgi:hypothetical protein
MIRAYPLQDQPTPSTRISLGFRDDERDYEVAAPCSRA